jgi:predicted nucleic acid-binding protein
VSRYVVDASVAFKWFTEEVHSEAARRLLDGSHTLLAPDLLYVEFANILWKRFRRLEMSEEEVAKHLQALGSLMLDVHPSWPLVLSALEIACHTGRSAYDSLYMALAVQEATLMVTADERLYNDLQGTPLAPYLCWVEDAA